MKTLTNIIGSNQTTLITNNIGHSMMHLTVDSLNQSDIKPIVLSFKDTHSPLIDSKLDYEILGLSDSMELIGTSIETTSTLKREDFKGRVLIVDDVALMMHYAVQRHICNNTSDYCLIELLQDMTNHFVETQVIALENPYNRDLSEPHTTYPVTKAGCDEAIEINPRDLMMTMRDGSTSQSLKSLS